MPIQALCILMGLPKYFLENMYKDAPNFNNFQLFRTDNLKIQLLRFKCMKTALFCRLFTQYFTPDICRIKVSRSWTWRFEKSLYVFVAPTIAENQKEICSSRRNFMNSVENKQWMISEQKYHHKISEILDGEVVSKDIPHLESVPTYILKPHWLK